MTSSGFQAVHIRHLHVHQDHVEGFALQAFQRLAAGGGDGHGVTAPFQQPPLQLLVHRVVLGQQHAKARRRLRWVLAAPQPLCR